MRKAITALISASLVLSGLAGSPATSAEPPHVLVYHGTFGFRHPVIEHSNDVLQQLADETGAFTVEFTINPADINAAKLAESDILLFNSSTGKSPFTEDQKTDMFQWLSCGGGFMGIHASADGNYGNANYAELLGAQFDSHPHNEGDPKVRFVLEHKKHPTNKTFRKKFGKKGSFKFSDELYRWRATPRRIPGVKVMYSLDEKTESEEIQKGLTPYEHRQPMAWAKTFRGRNRVYFTNLGHGNASWDWPVYQKSLVDAIKWVGKKRPDAKCLESEADIPPSPLKPPGATEPALAPCTIPAQPERPGPNWQNSGEAKRLTEEGDSMQMPSPGLPGGLGWSEQTYVLDLSKSGAAS
ncbi:MAG TPA: ThuA domain-containing protein, partial [Actinomycetota bacterium]|nr:ThuA domain-containing protein [Actinomycetota bacterium]